ncbi:unnamed protein product [Phytomonas sp. EM1]|nr:unnamed protein product [Phytomonas sp. EM1]|eukprot:CCW62350.1 unnamed protein product [Phytomonas sp. isolate EM1]
MTYRPPINRLTDILKRNNPQVLKRHAEDLTKALSSLPPEANQTRFIRNHFLISPKALHLLCDEQILERYKVFAVYKPPFCPMRRRDADLNYHKVSVESYITAALQSQLVHPILRRVVRKDAVKIRVLNDLDLFASGPVAVSVSDACSFNTSLASCVMNYDVLVAGHLPLTRGESKAIEVERLYPDLTPSTRPAAGHARCTFEVKRNAYYSVHPVTLLEVKIHAPPSARPPCIEAFVRNQLGSFVVGDPTAFEDPVRSQTKGGRLHSTMHEPPTHAARAGEATPLASDLLRSSVISMRGDCDFPRVFTHLREIHFSVDVLDVSGNPIGNKDVNFHCWKCVEPILRDVSHATLKTMRINLLDGSWTPSSEFLY